MIQGAPIGARLEHCTFDNFEVTDLNREPFELCLRLAREGRPGVLLMGKNGVGKTHLLVATMKSFDRRLAGRLQRRGKQRRLRSQTPPRLRAKRRPKRRPRSGIR